MKQGIAFCGICGIAAAGVLTALREMGLEPNSIFLRDNSVLPVYLYVSGLDGEQVMDACRRLRSAEGRTAKNLEEKLTGRGLSSKLYVCMEAGDYTSEPLCFSRARDLTGSCAFVRVMVGEHLSGQKPDDEPPQTWPLTCMGCDRILLVSPSCCKVDSKCDLHLRLPAYEPGAVHDARVSFFQGYRAVRHIEKKIYEKLLF